MMSAFAQRKAREMTAAAAAAATTVAVAAQPAEPVTATADLEAEVEAEVEAETAPQPEPSAETAAAAGTETGNATGKANGADDADSVSADVLDELTEGEGEGYSPKKKRAPANTGDFVFDNTLESDNLGGPN